MADRIDTVLLTLSRENVLEDAERDFLARSLTAVNCSAAIASAAGLPTMLAAIVPEDEWRRLVGIARAVSADEGVCLCAVCGKEIAALEARLTVFAGDADDPVRGSVHLSCAADAALDEIERAQQEA